MRHKHMAEPFRNGMLRSRQMAWLAVNNTAHCSVPQLNGSETHEIHSSARCTWTADFAAGHDLELIEPAEAACG